MDSKINIDSNFWGLFPNATINVLTLNGVSNVITSENKKQTQILLDNASFIAHKFLTEENFSANLIVQDWRQAFIKFKRKKGARSSIEALLKRVTQTHDFHPINPLVDIYNSISLEYGVPCGGEDLNMIVGEMHLGTALGGEKFKALGADEDEPALPGELIYYDEEGAICRSFNWREAERTMLTESTTDAIMVIESLNDDHQKRGVEAIVALKNRINKYLGVDGQIAIFTSPNK
ncbi:B3/B4 domain-containing protein [Lactovum miscens]|uniref:DNA/RNA-binding domain of Phe-tRNA-synthetase-like protein n=1 Tax=Lactovum miscens TaxID=190387 RepID=A0A841C9Q9_9LACT|nr:phenylalanine--tRNA ligase beta subunit-related protein [Lactovum miscens]MBB5888322.1 DNA/RNA-binding domain of Phe-tRNA-synthetase-like protein [Lactovum miscens]